MPCSDVTEIIEVELDGEDRLQDYRFSKRTCGQGIGVASLLLEKLAGRSLDEILAIEVQDFLAELSIADELEEFMSLKHLIAIQSALEVLTGKESGGKDDPFSAAEIVSDEDVTRIRGVISVDLITEKIRSCGGCKGCGSATEKAQSRRKIVFA
ncbi:MAG: iron-sulfur cluster assembly scaffold protein [Candidatus Hydrogenedentes bacterium]|nr:iron-sulfur cluster assembly scaffold protein [Candidatus Hydrogenedentota bacterium]